MHVDGLHNLGSEGQIIRTLRLPFLGSPYWGPPILGKYLIGGNKSNNNAAYNCNGARKSDIFNSVNSTNGNSNNTDEYSHGGNLNTRVMCSWFSFLLGSRAGIGAFRGRCWVFAVEVRASSAIPMAISKNQGSPT